MSRLDGRFSTVIRVPIRADFFKEPNKGTLINNLLADYYGLECIESDSETVLKEIHTDEQER